ncbi:MAG: alpha/beta fold hydrolase [Gemmataceae bacterium]|nr:alpha/beta fold hydrolase [Gemmataceae bacterium]
MHLYIRRTYVPVVVRIFQEKPLFIMPFGQPVADAEEVALMTPDGLTLHGCYLRATQPRKGVLLFGLEFGSNRWACLPYCEFLRAVGYDIFTFEMRGQGESPAQTGYEPLQWVTDFEVIDFQTAVAYLKTRADRDPRGIGFFGLSKGGSAGLMVAAQDPYIRCCVVDGIFASLTTTVPYMRRFVQIYSRVPWLAKHFPYWYLRIVGNMGLRKIEKLRDCHYPLLERSMPKLSPRPLLMIHGGGDIYITPEMAKSLFALAQQPKELWLVEKAKHNQSLHLAGDEYKKRVQEFFDKNLAGLPSPASNGAPQPGATQTEPSSR